MFTSIALPVNHSGSPARSTYTYSAGTPSAATAEAFPEPGVGGAVLHFAADTEIYAEGDETSSFYKVISGFVRTCKFLSDGRRQIDAFYGPGEVFGFEAGAEHRLSAEAVSDCSIVPFRRRGFEGLAGRDDRVAGQLLTHVMRCLARSQDHALVLGRRSAVQKLAAFLMEMAKPNETTFDLAMTRQDIADYLGLTIETVSRTLSQLERDGVIALPSTRRVYLKDRNALLRMNA